ncbi:MAG TPA: ABC transporter permease [Bryobacteraceae bacterium]
MSLWRQFTRGVRILGNRRAADREIADEVNHYLEEATATFVASGLSPDEARRAARMEIGNVTSVREQVRTYGWENWLDTLFSDLRYAVRQMRRSPGFAVTTVLILSLGIAANVIVFGVLQALILRPLDVPHQERMMTLARSSQTYPVFSYPEIRDLRDDNAVLSAVAAFSIGDFGVESGGVTRPVWGLEVSGQYFEAVAVKPFLGRLLRRADDDHPGASQAAVLSWPAWNADFGADPHIVGKTIRINKHPYTIVGVTPQGFYGTERFLQPDIFVPLANEASLDGYNWLDARRDWHVYSIVRVKDGVTLGQVQANLSAVAARITRQYPKEEEKLGFRLTRPGLMGDFLGAPARGFLAGVMGLAVIVLLAACANLGSLFAARTADRAREIAIRLAIGSSRWRILRQILIEALVISVPGGACACGLAWIALSNLAIWHPPTEFPLRFHVLPQPSLILMALLISVLAGVLFGIMPLRQIFKTDPNDTIKSGGAQFSAGRRWALRDVLLAAQIALCCVTVTAAFVSLRGLGKAMTMDLGFNPKNAVRTQFDLSQADYSSAAADRFQRRLLERTLQLPGVEAAGYANITQLSGYQYTSSVFSERATDFRPSKATFDTYHYAISPGYLTASGTPLLAGRDVSFSDTPKTAAVAIVNREFARRLLHSEQAVGRYFKNSSGVPIQIVGLVADGKHLSLSENPEAAAFFPISQEASFRTSLIVRTRPDPSGRAVAEMGATIRRAVRDFDRAIPIQQSGAWNGQLEIALFPAKVATVALGLFGAFGLLLSVTGTFGLASYTVSKRLRELTIRVALGAQAKQILSSALGRMLILLAGGSAVGILLGAATSRVLSAIVYQASAQDPFVLIAVVLTTLLAGLLSVVNPVRRALHIDPAKLLREQ